MDATTQNCTAMVCEKIGHEVLSPRSAGSDKSTSASAELEAFSKTSTMGPCTRWTPLPPGWGSLQTPVEQALEELKQETSIAQNDTIKGDCLVPVGWGQHRTLREELHKILASEA
mmetsp:Transcript_38912/g.77226  ORF Transcript_38912/g.77226 Transcript_38912/m.77226 type:complete len:115 (+) Transcript_38912:118-462(+)